MFNMHESVRGSGDTVPESHAHNTSKKWPIEV
jgi:hypothetical protein